MVAAMITGRARCGLSLLAAAFLLAACESATAPQPQPSAIVQVAAGRDFTCAVADNDAVYCWGLETQGRLGHDLGESPCTGLLCLTPVAVETGVRFDSVSLGDSHGCGLVDVRAYCWGWNLYGQLGDDRVRATGCRAEGTGAVLPCVEFPVTVALGFPLIDVTAGSNHSCAVATDGLAYCWGWNRGGQLGVGGPLGGQALAPRAVEGGFRFSDISAGEDHTCALTSWGGAYCWGAGAAGRLGNGTVNTSTVPVATVPGPAFAALDAGGGHTCALTAAGDLWCWGSGAWGQTGIGFLHSAVPVRVSLPEPVTAVSAGYGHTCAVVDSGALYCWGWNESGQVSGSGSVVPEPRLLEVGEPFIDVAAGYDHTCGLGVSGALYCWGDNSAGQLGTGDTAPSAVPVRVVFPGAV